MAVVKIHTEEHGMVQLELHIELLRAEGENPPIASRRIWQFSRPAPERRAAIPSMDLKSTTYRPGRGAWP